MSNTSNLFLVLFVYVWINLDVKGAWAFHLRNPTLSPDSNPLERRANEVKPTSWSPRGIHVHPQALSNSWLLRALYEKQRSANVVTNNWFRVTGDFKSIPFSSTDTSSTWSSSSPSSSWWWWWSTPSPNVQYSTTEERTLSSPPSSLSSSTDGQYSTTEEPDSDSDFFSWFYDWLCNWFGIGC